MTRRSVLGACALALMGAADARERVDLLLHDARIYTGVERAPWAEALAVQGGRVVAVGADDEIVAAFTGEALDLNGRLVLPGFIDAHVHPIAGGLQLLHCDLSAAATIEALTAMIRACHEATPGHGWLIGAGWNLSLFENANPQASMLDAIAPGRPVFLRGADGHSSWASNAALALAGIDAETPDPPDGVIERDASSRPTGTLRESAQALIEALLPPVSLAMREEALERALALAAQHGITSLIDAGVTVEEWELYRRFADEGRLTARVHATFVGDPLLDTDSADTPADVIAASRSHPLLRGGAIKIFADGVLEGETAALLAPYASGRNGSLKLSPEALSARVTDLDARDLQVHVHAIGDAAVRAALDAFEAAAETNGARVRRHHIAHLQLVHPDDHPRFAELGVTANFQALWAFPDDYIMKANLPAVGRARVDRMYPIGSLHRAGARLVFGSDWPVTSIEPLLAIETAMTRMDPTGAVRGALNSRERVDLETALAAYTTNGAWLVAREHELGSLERGKHADLVVLDRNVFEVPPNELSEARVVATLVGGRFTFRDASLDR